MHLVLYNNHKAKKNKKKHEKWTLKLSYIVHVGRKMLQ